MDGELARSKRRLLFALVASAVASISSAAVSGPFHMSSGDRAAVREAEPWLATAKSVDAMPYSTELRTGNSRGVARLKTKCAGCGVVESIRKVDLDEPVGGRCLFNDADGSRLAGALLDSGSRDKKTLSEALTSSISVDGRASAVRRTTGYQIVVRFRDGTRHVFTESAPRTLRMEGMLVASPRFAG